ncbi:MAG: YjjG family noncanonical pyrimidine nucleotidase [Oscillospiraceae bacterium]|nr:YjjG family noncanonical pyrimidine nucleotidase [Oscillospiraceae bacterium]
MRYTIALLDLDNTILDFNAASHEALEKTFLHFGLPYSEEEWACYAEYNSKLWRAYERKEIPKSLIYEERFRLYLEDRKLDADPAALNAMYLPLLGVCVHLMPHSIELLTALKERGLTVCVVTNGETETAYKRIARGGLNEYFDHIFISEEIGHAKPSTEFFDAVYAKLGEDKRAGSIILGDSLTSDMQGGKNAGIATCLFRIEAEPDERCDYAIDDLRDFLKLL